MRRSKAKPRFFSPDRFAEPARKKLLLREAGFHFLVVLLSVAGHPAAILSQAKSSQILAGTVASQEGKPLTGVRIILKDSAGKIVAQLATNNEGRYCFAGLGTGQYSLTAEPAQSNLKTETTAAHLPPEGLMVDWKLSAANAIAAPTGPAPASCESFFAGVNSPNVIGLGAIGGQPFGAGTGSLVSCANGRCTRAPGPIGSPSQ